ncbi:MAG TPA: cation transporter [Ktedonobacterales bacterium]|nr:cation transporter [Ktedonobacterales bacterium]
MSVPVQHAAQVRLGVRVEVFTVVWMVVEAVVSIGAGVLAGSLLLIAFGLDSVIELVSGGILLWRLSVEARGSTLERVERAEHRAAWVVAVSLALLCVYVLGSAIFGLVTQEKPESSLVGIVVSLAAVLVMPGLGITKRRIAARIDSGALRGDAASSFTCGYMAATVLVGLVLNALFHWWWAEDVAAFVFLFWLVQEAREALEEAREAGEHKEGEGQELRKEER